MCNNRTLRFLLSAIILLASAVVVSAKTYVVCVGINKYPQSPLRLCVADADSVKYIYDHQRATQTIILRDRQATRENILATLRQQFSRASAHDRVLFYFAGHGYPGGFCAIDGNMSYSDIRRAMAGSSSNHKIIFADACFAGKMRNTQQSIQQQTQMKDADVLLFLASRSNETSGESMQVRNGYFTSALKRGLRGAADVNRDRTITASELFTYVHNKVKSTTNNKQHPVMWGNFSDNMAVINW